MIYTLKFFSFGFCCFTFLHAEALKTFHSSCWQTNSDSLFFASLHFDSLKFSSRFVGNFGWAGGRFVIYHLDACYTFHWIFPTSMLLTDLLNEQILSVDDQSLVAEKLFHDTSCPLSLRTFLQHFFRRRLPPLLAHFWNETFLSVKLLLHLFNIIIHSANNSCLNWRWATNFAIPNVRSQKSLLFLVENHDEIYGRDNRLHLNNGVRLLMKVRKRYIKEDKQSCLKRLYYEA